MKFSPIGKPALRNADIPVGKFRAGRKTGATFLLVFQSLGRYDMQMEFLDPNPSPRLAGRYDRGYLPHVRAQGRSYFVTFRLEGTLPQELLRQYQAEREALLATAEQTEKDASTETQRSLFGLYSEKIETYLDAGYGECWLKEARIAELMAGAFRFFDGQRYDLGPWVVMPNHVHVIVRPLGTHLLDEIVKSWKGFTAREANRLLARTGESFWAREYYDHIVRDDEERARLANYIHDNPVKAGLCERWEDWKWSTAHRM
ncbi:MAG TPA: transposase [Candidatus Eisenbacteria bacterium]|nr:transposase [Candidatus Eisenbacteria bacterium]